MSWKELDPNSDLYTYEYISNEDVCRICLSQNGENYISFTSSIEVENKYSAADTVLQFIGIDLTLNTLPPKICYSCSGEVEYFTEFRRFCHQTQKKLYEIHQRGPPDSKSDILLKNDYEPIDISHNSDLYVANTLLNSEKVTSSNDKLDLPFKHGCEFNDFSDIDVANSFQNCQTPDKDITNSYEDAPLTDLELAELLGANEEQKPKKVKIIKKNPDSAYYCKFKSCQYDLGCSESFANHNTNIHRVENGIYKCFGCDKTFKNRKRCLVHEFLSCKSLQNGYKCDYCKSYIHKRSYFEKHLLAHERSEDVPKITDFFKCKKCGKVFKSVELLNGHLRSHGNEKEHWVCDTCGRVFLRRDYLYKHKLIHEGRKIHACTQCDFKTVQKSSLNVHMRKHTGERPFACSICPQRCVNNSNLQKHMKLHLGIKQFQCKLCDKRFAQKISLQEHTACIHDSCSEVHACGDCGATYTRFRHLQRHLRTKHGKKISKCKMADAEKAANEDKMDDGS